MSTGMAAEPRSAAYLELLAGVMDAFAQSRNLNDTLQDVLARITAAMDAEAASLFLLDGELGDPRTRLVCQASVGPNAIRGLALPAAAGIVGRAVATNTTQLVADTRIDPDFVAPPTSGVYEVRSLVCAPLSVRGERLGAVEVINRRGADALFDADDRDALEALAAAAALAIANARLTQSLMEQERLQRELELAATVQRNLLPSLQPREAAIHGLSVPARGVSGDFYDILPLSGGRTVFALADVSGKGMNAALIMVKAATLFRCLAKKVHEPGLLLARIESELCETMTLGMFVTMVVGVYDPASDEVRFSNAGHEPPLLRRADGAFESFQAPDPPIGVISPLANRRYHETAVTLAGGSLYFYTDGATDGRLPDGSALGEAGLKRLIAEHAPVSAIERLTDITGALTAGSRELHDDITLLVIEEQQGAARLLPRPERRRGRGSFLVAQTVPARVSQLRVVRRLVEAAALQAGAAGEWARDLALAVDEGCQNIIRHAYGGECDSPIRIRVRRRADRMQVELVDYAPPVDRKLCKGRELGEVRPGGLGRHFMQALTDSVRFLRPPAGAGNRLLLSKKLPDRRGAAP